MRTIIVDADVLCYEASHSAQRTIEWEPGMFTIHGNLDQAKQIVDEKLARICDSLAADRLVLALSDYSDPWRKRVMPTIKANRSTVAKPVLLHPLRDYLHERYETFQRPTLEGDDVMGILGTHPTLLPGQKILVTIDKDLKGVPGFLAQLDKLDGSRADDAIVEISEAQADYFHMLQALAGDPTDGYPGCPKIGMVKAEKILSICSDDSPGGPFLFAPELAWPLIVEQYRKAGLGVEVALQNARVARICRFRDYDYEKKQVILWQPPV